MRIIAGQKIRLMTSDVNGNIGPFINEITGNPVTPSSVACKFRIEPNGGRVGPTITVVSGTPYNYDAYNTAVTIAQDGTTGGWFLYLVTTLFLSSLSPVPTSAILRSVWLSTDAFNPAVSKSKLDTLYPADL